MLSLQELSDRLEINQVILDYATAIDTRRFDGLDHVFTADAYIDYRQTGGIDGRYPEVKAYLQEGLARFPHYYHMTGAADIRLSGDEATSRTACFNPMEVTLADGTAQVMFLGLWYIDRHVRTKAGWRIAERGEEACYAHNVPGDLFDIARIGGPGPTG